MNHEFVMLGLAAARYVAVVVRLLTRVGALEDDVAREVRDDRGQAGPSRQHYSFV
jgi:hypothetical protein